MAQNAESHAISCRSRTGNGNATATGFESSDAGMRGKLENESRITIFRRKKRLHDTDDIIGVRMFDKNFTVENVEDGKILLIYLNEKKIYKIRIKGEPAEGNAYNTYYYRSNEKTKSSRPHGIDSIKGVIVEVNHRV